MISLLSLLFNILKENGTLVFNTEQNVNIEMIYTGFWYRATLGNPDAVIGLLGVKIGYVRVAYSYDFTISELRSASGGSHEVSFTFNLGGEDNSLNPKRKYGKLACPSFLNF